MTMIAIPRRQSVGQTACSPLPPPFPSCVCYVGVTTRCMVLVVAELGRMVCRTGLD